MKVEFSPEVSAVFLERITYCLSSVLSIVLTFPGSSNFGSPFTLPFACSTVHFAVFRDTCTKLISVTGKIMEDLSSVWGTRKWLEKNQHGKLCLTNPIPFYDVTTCSMCNSRAVEDIYLDLAKCLTWSSAKSFLMNL